MRGSARDALFGIRGFKSGGIGWLLTKVSRIDKIIGLFCRLLSLLYGSFAKETHNLIDPTDHRHPIVLGGGSVSGFRVQDLGCIVRRHCAGRHEMYCFGFGFRV